MIEWKVAIVSGVGSGIGKASARRLASLGAMVVVADILLAASEEIAAAVIASLTQQLTKPIDTARAIAFLASHVAWIIVGRTLPAAEALISPAIPGFATSLREDMCWEAASSHAKVALTPQ